MTVEQLDDGTVTGSGNLGSVEFTVTGQHSYPDVTFTAWSQGAVYLTFEGEFTDAETVEGFLEGWGGDITLSRVDEV